MLVVLIDADVPLSASLLFEYMVSPLEKLELLLPYNVLKRQRPNHQKFLPEGVSPTDHMELPRCYMGTCLRLRPSLSTALGLSLRSAHDSKDSDVVLAVELKYRRPVTER